MKNIFVLFCVLFSVVSFALDGIPGAQGGVNVHEGRERRQNIRRNLFDAEKKCPRRLQGLRRENAIAEAQKAKNLLHLVENPYMEWEAQGPKSFDQFKQECRDDLAALEQKVEELGIIQQLTTKAQALASAGHLPVGTEIPITRRELEELIENFAPVSGSDEESDEESDDDDSEEIGFFQG